MKYFYRCRQPLKKRLFITLACTLLFILANVRVAQCKFPLKAAKKIIRKLRGGGGQKESIRANSNSAPDPRLQKESDYAVRFSAADTYSEKQDNNKYIRIGKGIEGEEEAGYYIDFSVIGKCATTSNKSK